MEHGCLEAGQDGWIAAGAAHSDPCAAGQLDRWLGAGWDSWIALGSTASSCTGTVRLLVGAGWDGRIVVLQDMWIAAWGGREYTPGSSGGALWDGWITWVLHLGAPSTYQNLTTGAPSPYHLCQSHTLSGSSHFVFNHPLGAPITPPTAHGSSQGLVNARQELPVLVQGKLGAPTLPNEPGFFTSIYDILSFQTNKHLQPRKGILTTRNSLQLLYFFRIPPLFILF
ncbi:hypothetical protein C8J57DRAFT_1256457 [Mycena rebaudengoi]|nr:hypothetical protein C8J57DRAFT_1256457 [Mycena rebaudengoi]